MSKKNKENSEKDFKKLLRDSSRNCIENFPLTKRMSFILSSSLTVSKLLSEKCCLAIVIK